MKIISEEEIKEAAKCLREGGLVAFPTETVYGLGANALDPLAVARIFEAKKRPVFDPLIVHISDKNQLEELYEKPVQALVYQLAEKFWPGPLTIVHKKSGIVPDLISSGLDTVAVRMPSHAIALKLIALAGVPVAAPSANRFGQLSPTSYKHVEKQRMNIDYIIRGAEIKNAVGIESTVVSVDIDGTCTILRPGIITATDIEKAIPGLKVNTPGRNTKISSPGLLNSHYSPLKPLFFAASDTVFPTGSGLILHSKTGEEKPAERVIYTSETGNLIQVAANLFSSLHRMEEDPEVTQIFIERVEEKGIGVAIMDRLKKATFQYSK